MKYFNYVVQQSAIFFFLDVYLKTEKAQITMSLK